MTYSSKKQTAYFSRLEMNLSTFFCSFINESIDVLFIKQINYFNAINSKNTHLSLFSLWIDNKFKFKKRGTAFTFEQTNKNRRYHQGIANKRHPGKIATFINSSHSPNLIKLNCFITQKHTYYEFRQQQKLFHYRRFP